MFITNTSSSPSSRHLDSVPVFGHDSTVIVTETLDAGNCPETSAGLHPFPSIDEISHAGEDPE